MKNNSCPCRGCEDRATGIDHEDCHTTCEKFIDWKSERDANTAHEKEIKEISREYFPTESSKRSYSRKERKRKKTLKEIL